MTEYQKYQLQWMMDHNYSIEDLVRELRDFQYSDPEDSDRISTPIDELFSEWEHDIGFGSEIWACEREFRDSAESLENNNPNENMVSRKCYENILWENGIMRQQLAEVGKAFGEKMDNVAQIVRCDECQHAATYHESAICRRVTGTAEKFPRDFFCAYGEEPEDGKVKQIPD